MDKKAAEQVVSEVNEYLQNRPWFDFEIMEYQGDTLVVMGGIDISTPPEIEVRFRGVYFVSLLMEWKTNTTTPPLRLIDGEAAARTNRRFRVEQGHHIFSFTPEDFPADFACLLGARDISFKVVRQPN